MLFAFFPCVNICTVFRSNKDKTTVSLVCVQAVSPKYIIVFFTTAILEKKYQLHLKYFAKQ